MLETLAVDGDWVLWWNRETNKSDTVLRVNATHAITYAYPFDGKHRRYRLAWDGTHVLYSSDVADLINAWPGALLTIQTALAAAGVKP